MVRKYLVNTDHGQVVVRINEVASGLDPALLTLEPATPENSHDIVMEVPLRAFGAKMVEIIEMIGTGTIGTGTEVSLTLQRMMIQEKATEDLKRIERFARALGTGGGP